MFVRLLCEFNENNYVVGTCPSESLSIVSVTCSKIAEAFKTPDAYLSNLSVCIVEYEFRAFFLD